MQAYTQEHLNQLLLEIDAYFEESKDTQSYLWALTNKPLPFTSLGGGKSFGEGKSQIAVMDPFDNRKPGKLYHDYKTRRYDVEFRPTLLLDTQMPSYLREYITWTETGSCTLSEALRTNVHEFLRFVVMHGYDYNPLFYYIESVVKDTKGEFATSSASTAVAILKLHAMDEAEFLKSGKVVVDEKQLEPYRRNFGGVTLEETALLRSHEIASGLKHVGFEFTTQLIRAQLLQMAIIASNKKLGLLDKLGRLRDFQEDRLNIVMSQECFVALSYFSGITGSFIPSARPGVNVAKALSKFKSTAWDLLLLRIPPMQLMQETDDIAELCFICTADRAFAEIASQFVIAGITRLPYKPELSSDRIMLKQDKLEKLFGAEMMRQVNDYIERRSYYRMVAKLYEQATGVADRLISEGELSALIIELERQFSELCLSSTQGLNPR